MNIDLTAVAEVNGLIPPGNYPVVVDAAEVKQTKALTGEYINCKLKILGGSYDGRFLFHMFNIKNSNPKAVEIGLSQLKSFMKCAGFNNFVLDDVNKLCGKPCEAVVKIKTDDFGDKNVISYFKPLASLDTPAPPQKAASPFA